MPEPTLLLEASRQGDFDDELLSLIRLAPLPALGGQAGCEETARRVQAWLPNARRSDSLVAAALWLLSGELDKSHAISQIHDDADGSFWHGIMHRREGDFGNAKYWFRRVGKHPVLDELASHLTLHRTMPAGGLPGLHPFSIGNEFRSPEPGLLGFLLPASASTPLQTSELAIQLVSAVELATTEGRSTWQADLQAIFWWEWQLLFRYCW